MALEKLTIEVEGSLDLPIKALFNPERIQMTRSGWNQWMGELTQRDQPAVLSVELFFDTTLRRTDALLGGLAANLTSSLTSGLPSSLTSGLLNHFTPEDVRNYTQPIYNLTRKQGNSKPPFCKIQWGRGNVLLQRGFLQSVTKTLTHFWEDGTPVRATLNCIFAEVLDTAFEQRVQNPIDDPIRVVRRGETLSSIAAEEFNDPTQWRLIADANQLDNPRQIFPGQQLTVPPFRPDQTS